ncbi:Gfo/Idh/MocA family protein [Aquipuribacter sp. MA13-6]|uniref:Gfo/Idh/MocA family protein n=1 Tax=unclassified Aquipuribacter TaxID=2635084 RepID=UPI003EE8A3AF
MSTTSRSDPGRTGSTGFGFLGAGGIATGALAPAVHAADGAHLQAVAARSQQRAAALEPAGRAYDDYAAVLADETVDVVYVALSNDLHERWTVAALEAGKHVLCEKPLGLDAAQVRRMTDAAAAADRLLVEAWWYRWHPRTLRAVDLVRSGALGRVVRVETEFSFDADLTGNYRVDPTRGGGGIYDVGCYAVDAARWALQAGPLEVLSAEGEVRDGVDVRASARLGLPHRGDAATGSGAVVPPGAPAAPAPVDGPGAAPGLPDEPVAEVRCGIGTRPEQLVAVYGERATMVLGGESFATKDVPCSLFLHPVDGRTGRVEGGGTREDFPAVDPYRLMVEAVAAAVRGEDVWLPTAQDSLDIAHVTDAFRALVLGPAAHG